MLGYTVKDDVCMSPSTRRAWIEILLSYLPPSVSTVALHPEGVDRNVSGRLMIASRSVALHPEGVDRNPHMPTPLP